MTVFLKGPSFLCRDESSRLVELLRSRTTDLSYVDDRAPKVAEAAIEAPPQKDVISLRKQNNTSQPDQMMKNGHDTLLTTVSILFSLI